MNKVNWPSLDGIKLTLKEFPDKINTEIREFSHNIVDKIRYIWVWLVVIVLLLLIIKITPLLVNLVISCKRCYQNFITGSKKLKEEETEIA
ncbi:alpha gene product [Kotonkan virus]|uniref:Alpha 1 protein n=1 Tax=Kotonkan virus TaxID=318836 RepID=H8XWF5_9RHAB|nr:alpha gene product [Kotonkan virus]AEI17635.1 alpha 1 protein [Kotonkan virus]